MKDIRKLVRAVVMEPRGIETKLLGQPLGTTFVGAGRSAFVFKLDDEEKVIKVYFPEFSHLAQEEADIYRELHDIPYFPKIYEHGNDYLVMDYIRGKTFYDCLVEGVVVTEEMINKVDVALDMARGKGLNPSDIHLRNMILTPDGDVKLIDVVRFRQKKDCMQWQDLKKAYYFYYRRRLFPKRLSPVVIDLISKSYKKHWLPFV